ncbi:MULTISPECIES: M14 family zinc carboxypeptidase [Gammaproteobacteria]|uniref:M14 family zinc carboxypeptidase n=1 Tax=Gammaproteobacteria TaxID=1236 RepID=UPI000DCFB5C2|nr:MULTISPECIES: M14 family zinc carboxypeptidase [Gammaproteobacteria]RTE86490.1 peptidase M14 [Aliidiomarina sp. B3213]TCZ90955.1 peptidase M14 [Lysobacter sp. N42]
MFRKFLTLASIVLATHLPISANAYDGGENIDDVTLDYYLPDHVQYNPNIPKPSEVLGYEVGQWHVRHDQLVRYFEILAESSDRMTLEVTGYTHERRPLLIAKFSSAENQSRLEEMRQAHMAVSDPSQEVDATEAPLVSYLGFSVHGDESSGINASLLTAYYLAAAEGAEIESWLDNHVILVDPSLNPDGSSRFAQWANQYRAMTSNTDGNHIEHVQSWLRGRQNHYWFDLNRDWLLLQHPESRARVKIYQDWLPNVLTDHHEMGTDSTYFFQPGIPSRKNPDTPDENVELTGLIAQYHADALDELNSLYYTEESFDDFYYGKGSSYPDAQGTVGILFEQASSRGHVQDSVNGVVAFPFTIKNQFITSLSTLRGAVENRDHLLDYQQRFFKDNLELARRERHDGYMLREPQDPARLEELLNILAQHRIHAYPVTEEFTNDGTTYRPGEAYFVPVRQRNYRLLKGAFSTQQDFPNNTFYDVSAWTLPYAFNVEFEAVRTNRRFELSEQAWQHNNDFEANQLGETRVGYVFGWESYFAPRLLTALQRENIHARLAFEEMTISTPQGEQSFPNGAVIVTRAYQQRPWTEVQSVLAEQADANEIRVATLTSGLTPTTGMDIGSRSIDPAIQPKVLIVMGDGAHLQETGEAWYYLDRHVNLPVTMVETDRLTRVNLDDYTHILMVHGWYNGLSEGATNALRQWTRSGGTLIGQRGGAEWMAEQEILGATVVSDETFDEQFPTEGLNYAASSDYYSQRRIAGAIFNSDVDLTHPLMVGFSREQLPVFKNSTLAFEPSESPFVDVARYSETPVLAGFTSEGNRNVLSGKTSIIAHRYGSGRVIGFADNLNFRAFFWGTSKLLSNAIFWSQYINGRVSEEEATAEQAAIEESEHSH